LKHSRLMFGAALWTGMAMVTTWPLSALAAFEVIDRGSVELGVGSSDLGGKVAVDGSAGALGTEIDLSRDLDLAGRDRSRLFALRWQPWPRHGFGLRAQRFGRSADQVIQRDIVFDGEDFAVNSKVSGTIDLDLLSFTYTNWLLAQPRRAFGLSVGALQYRLGLNLAAENLPGGAQPAPVQADVSADLPVLVLGAEFREALSERLRLVLRAAVFKASINDIDGTVYDLEAGMEYALTPNWVLAARYSATRLDADSSREDLVGRLRLDLSGAQGALIWRW
jgi:hypothetical protein